eukprot:m.103456 g.103456  ORF g.103456 m.103456 type:complete len:70 (-) comp9096_c3_seq1:374-583(-)
MKNEIDLFEGVSTSIQLNEISYPHPQHNTYDCNALRITPPPTPTKTNLTVNNNRNNNNKQQLKCFFFRC